VVGRANAYKSIIQGLPVEAPNIPESFKVLISELRSLGLNLDLIPEDKPKDDVEVVEAKEDTIVEEDREPEDNT